jgi:hypothetical protein
MQYNLLKRFFFKCFFLPLPQTKMLIGRGCCDKYDLTVDDLQEAKRVLSKVRV